jgi:hypothetical protein
VDVKAATIIRYCEQRGYPAPVAEFRFSPPRRWRFDLCWQSPRLALEFEGGAFSHGRHVRGEGFTHDCLKYSRAALLGWRLLRATTEMLNSGVVFGWLDHEFGEHGGKVP